MSEYLLVAGRALLSFLILFLLARILGKKQIYQLTFFDYVVGIAIGDMASTIVIDKSVKILNGIIGLVVFTILSLLIGFGAVKSFRFREIVESSPTILVKDGKVMEKSLLKERMTFDDLLNGLRIKGAFNLSEVELAMLETNGEISVLKKPKYQAITPNDIGLSVEEDHGPSLAIIDGMVLEKHLNYLGYSKEWLLQEIKKQGASNTEDVFLAQINSDGSVYVDLYNDKKNAQDKNPEKQEKQKPNLAIKLRKIQVELEQTAFKTKDNNAKKMYFSQSKEMEQIIKKLNPYLSG
ncbi:DUF421 domain-containing protein [Fredinandcohnia onubensis]|uniref:DUF421 domain-containing protein n=1 Tax=Fredinandcohnia onubensis TaxID=1571209 RepID=UPI000C0BD647|nr:DUF421 domain-containing protein [Fredinandcohnia onubensis]